MHLQVSGAGNLTSEAREHNGRVYVTIATNFKSNTTDFQSTAYISGSIKADSLSKDEMDKLTKGRFVRVSGYLSTYKGSDDRKETIVNISKIDFPVKKETETAEAPQEEAPAKKKTTKKAKTAKG